MLQIEENAQFEIFFYMKSGRRSIK